MFRLIRFTAAAGSLLLLFTASPVSAQTVATTFTELRIPPGTAVVVLDRRGRETGGHVDSLSGSLLSLIVDGQAQPFMESDTLRISRDGDSLKNGAFWGLGAGAAMGILAINTCEPDCRGGAGKGGAVAMLAGYGLGVGVLIDRLVSGRTHLYQAPAGVGSRVRVAPVLARRGSGFAVQVSF
jgi:hypothetical protein